ncbi:MAG TPA: hypothetical protein VL221_04085 [Bacteroidota bacterium]|nr:hypothetical protein [Bacteroidota bacterium]
MRLTPVVALVILASPAFSLPRTTTGEFTIHNTVLTCTVGIQEGHLAFDRVLLNPAGGSSSSAELIPVETDGDFALEIMWSDWRPPGAKNNGENPVTLTARDFTFDTASTVPGTRGGTELRLDFTGPDGTIRLRVTYGIGAGDFYVRKTIAVMDSTGAGHFLRQVRAMDCILRGSPAIRKSGGFGQPAASTYAGRTGAFFGLEYPASRNSLVAEGADARLRCGEEIGEPIGNRWLSADPAVEGVTPDTAVRQWFWHYVDDIRVAPLRPYTLYNSWYDIRSPDFRNIDPAHVMNEENILRIIGLIDRNMIDKHGIRLDAFVLDDGWDVYESDWQLRPVQFPHGLKPIADELKKTNTALGMWLGPTGGYSFHDRRMGWMKAHGYEIVDDQLCLAGEKYSALFRKRVEDFVRDDGVGYFKWDGIQFVCNDPSHGHPVDIYSRRAVIESVIDKCRAVRAINPATFLNVTSGTWLSPWWLPYANQIWMDGQDYGYADVPSISPRDAAITYRDFVLYEDLRTKDLWFPVANMMTHGIIKGDLEKLGGEHEPLDKFTNEALLYFARGVSMWEMYISPDLLSDGEWDAMAQSMQWARDRFPVLSTTTMVGGDPKARETYGYVHFRGKEGVIAARNPSIEPGSLQVALLPSEGLDPSADSLVLERVYPSLWISPALTRAGSLVTLPLDGYETAVYELYPLKSATVPLVAGVRFAAKNTEGTRSVVACYPEGEGRTRVLNPSIALSAERGGHSVTLPEIRFDHGDSRPAGSSVHVGSRPGTGAFEFSLDIDASAHNAMLAVLLKPSPGTQPSGAPAITAHIDGSAVQLETESQKGMWAWYTVPVRAGTHSLSLLIAPGGNDKSWKGLATAYLICDRAVEAQEVSFVLKAPPVLRPMPPLPAAPGEFRVNELLVEQEISAAAP